jgi:uncharacterized protein YjbI with pentapeptide repeats
VFASVDLSFSDLSHAILDKADLSDANLHRANLHAVRADGASWARANRASARDTDDARLAAEAYIPPPVT